MHKCKCTQSEHPKPKSIKKTLKVKVLSTIYKPYNESQIQMLYQLDKSTFPLMYALLLTT